MTEFAEDSVCVIPELVKPDVIQTLRVHFQKLLKNGGMKLGDGQSPLRYIAYKDPEASLLQPYFIPVVTDISGVPVKSTYNYTATYIAGAKLPPHTDRPQCEFTISLAIESGNEKNDGYVWPIVIGTKKITLKPGDAALYKGIELNHYRNTLPEGNTVTNIFFHYVNESFSGSLD